MRLFRAQLVRPLPPRWLDGFIRRHPRRALAARSVENRQRDANLPQRAICPGPPPLAPAASGLEGPRREAPRRRAVARTAAARSARPGPEQDPVAAHPEALNLLYLVYCCACLVERTWRFGLPLVLAFVEGGYQAIALLGFVSPAACIVLGPAVGRMLDRLYRPYGLGGLVAAQGLAILASCLALLAAAAQPGVALVRSALFGPLLVLSALERLTAVASELAIERDWVTQLAGKDHATVLARSNAVLRRTDLCCELVGALLFGWAYSSTGLRPAIVGNALLAAVAVPAQLLLISRIASLAPVVMAHGREELPAAAAARVEPRRPAVAGGAWPRRLPGGWRAAARRSLLHSLDGWGAYARQPILPASLAYVVLFCNVALSPGGLITALLTSHGLGGNGMAAFKCGCACMGFLGTWVGRRLIEALGLVRAGRRAMAIQLAMLAMATGVYATCMAGGSATALGGGLASLGRGLTIGGAPAAVVAFAALVVSSRCGIWAFDMVNVQLFQQTVPQREMASASSAEMALCSMSELLMLGLAAYCVAPGEYAPLVYGSFGAVLLSNLLYRAWSRGAQARLDAALEAAA